MPRAAAAAIAAVVVAVVGFATLIPRATPVPPVALCILCGDLGLADGILNTLLFVPVGAAFARLFGPARAVLYGSLLSAAVEVVQLGVPGRHTSPGDLLFNTLGAALGVLILVTLPTLIRPGRRRALALASVWTGAALSIVLATHWLFQPALPTTGWYGQWTPRFDVFASYDGRVIDARIGERTLPSHRLNDSSALRARLLEGTPLEIDARAGSTTERIAPIFSMGSDSRQEVLLLGADGPDLVWRVRTRAADIRLAQPFLRVPHALASVVPGDTMHLEAVVARGERGHDLKVNGRRERVEYRLVDGWTLLIEPSFATSGAGRASARIAWLALLFGPPVLWFASALRTRAS